LPSTLHATCLLLFYLFFSCYGDLRDLHSFPTRRSSDLCRHYVLYSLISLPTPDCKSNRPAPGKSCIHDDERFGFSNICYFLPVRDRKSTRLNSSHVKISYAVFCLKKKKKKK